MDTLTLKRHGATSITRRIARITAEHGLTNVFNASVAFASGSTYATVRALPPSGEKPFRGYLIRFDDAGHELTDLATLVGDTDLPKIADPKLVLLGEELYLTFNTGESDPSRNAIYLLRVSPTPGPLQRVDYDQRREIEKNWAFALAPDGRLKVIYSLSPLTMLSLSEGELGVTPTLTVTADRTPTVPKIFPRLHIGSQPVTFGGRALLVANRTVWVPKLTRKFYFGWLAEVDLDSGELTRLSRRALIHSWPSMVPPQGRRRHNPILWSATYFAGLARLDDDLVLGYGINDRAIGVARVPEHAVWR
jgi:hypothetical protein